MYGFRHVNRRRNSVAPLSRIDYDSQSKARYKSIFHVVSDRVTMKMFLYATLILSLFVLAWPLRAYKYPPHKRVLLGLQDRQIFSIGSDRFYVNGEPTRLISCELHYFRIPFEYWRDRLQRSKSLGCNSVQTYIPWNFHEPAPGVFDFDGQHDAAAFIRLAQAEGMHVLLRPGPYVCAEWDFGGLPAWLLDQSVTGKPLLGHLRTNDPVFMKFVRSWWQELLPRMKPLLFSQGGPILMVQIENEYGFRTFLREQPYLEALRDIAKQHLGDGATLYTTDPPGFLSWGGLKGTYHAVDFGPNKPTFLSFVSQKLSNAGSHEMASFNSEFYTGWLTRWGDKMANTSCSNVVRSLTNILQYGGGTGSVNFYMAHGGTNFAFWAGCNGDEFDMTSYDYNCPISESAKTGQPGVGGPNKFEAVRNTIAKVTGETLPDALPEPDLVAHGKVIFKHVASLMDNLDQLHAEETAIFSKQPLTMEEYGMAYGMLGYSTTTPCHFLRGSQLTVKAYDFAQILVDGIVAGELWRAKPSSLVLPADVCADATADANVSILVSTYGRDNFYVTGTTEEMLKGIVGAVVVQSADGTSRDLTNWYVHAMPLIQPGMVLPWAESEAELSTADLVADGPRMAFDSLHGSVWRKQQKGSLSGRRPSHRALQAEPDSSKSARGTVIPGRFASGTSRQLLTTGRLKNGPMFYRGEITIAGEPKDSYLATRAWTRGYVWVNGNNVGRFWTPKGPQQALFVPGVFLYSGINEIVVLELEAKREGITQFVSAPDFSGPVLE